ncbi:MAG: apolipoprotein N-acyltransferase [Crocinitomicaceae bacterium]|nr:apolipoprotein N-acyltransferase [Crocinitomicaceae bacterium]
MIELKKKHRFLLSILAGILMTISFPYTGSLTFVAFVAWVPILFLENYISAKKYKSRKVFTHAYTSFFTYNLLSTWWIWNASFGGAMLAIILNSLLMALVFSCYHLTKKHVGNKEGYLSLLIYWIGFEYLHYNWEASWTWLTLGNTFSITPSLIQWYSYTGVLGGSLWVLMVNLVFYRIYQNVYFKKESWKIQTPIFYSAAFLLIAPTLISLISYTTYEETKNPINVIAIQPNIDPYNEKFEPGMLQHQLEKIATLAAKKWTDSTDLIVAPETAISASFFEGDIQQLEFFHYLKQQKAKLNNTPWYIGASTMAIFEKKNSRASMELNSGPGYIEHYNSSFLIREDNSTDFVHKSKLVPGVEVIPFSEYLGFLEDLSIDNGGTSGTLGIEEEPQIFETADFKFAPVVCYESIYGEWVTEQCRKGAQLICIATNDGWWKDTPGYKQHNSFASLRAIENRRSVVRSANTGTSCFINQRGDISQPTQWWVPDAITEQVNLNTEQTFYTTYGNVLGRSFSFVSVFLLLFTFVKRFKKKYISK